MTQKQLEKQKSGLFKAIIDDFYKAGFEAINFDIKENVYRNYKRWTVLVIRFPSTSELNLYKLYGNYKEGNLLEFEVDVTKS